MGQVQGGIGEQAGGQPGAPAQLVQFLGAGLDQRRQRRGLRALGQSASRASARPTTLSLRQYTQGTSRGAALEAPGSSASGA